LGSANQSIVSQLLKLLFIEESGFQSLVKFSTNATFFPLKKIQNWKIANGHATA